MLLKDRIAELRSALESSHSGSEWKQRIAHPEEHEAEGWGASDLIAENPETQKWEHVARVFDSGNMQLVLAMRKHIEALIDAAEDKLQS